MFDPTVFDNLKVAIENQVYDLDNLDHKIRVTGRLDQLELSVLSRTFVIRFALAEQERDPIIAEIRLEASLRDLAAEILELQGEVPAVQLTIAFEMQLEDVGAACQLVEERIQAIWQPEQPPVQTISYRFGQETRRYHNKIELDFHRKINEEQMDDLPDLIDHVIQTLSALARIAPWTY